MFGRFARIVPRIAGPAVAAAAIAASSVVIAAAAESAKAPVKPAVAAAAAAPAPPAEKPAGESEAGKVFGHYDHAAEISTVPCAKSVAPLVPPPYVGDRKPHRHVLDMKSTAKVIQLTPTTKYMSWTFDDVVPGPVIRARVGDWLEVRHYNEDSTGMAHNIDFHAVTGPGGGAPATYAEPGEVRAGLFKLLYPGVYIYHCAAAPLPAHIGNGMYGLIIVDPKSGPIPSPPTLVSKEDLKGDGVSHAHKWGFFGFGMPGATGKPTPTTPTALPSASAAAAAAAASAAAPLKTPDGRPLKEFAIIQSDFYATDATDAAGVAGFDYQRALDENPTSVVFNGREGALTEKPIVVQQGDRVRLYVGNAGPNLVSSFHVIGAVFDAVWREGDFTSPPARGIQSVLIPAGGAAVVEFDALVPGSLTMVDHSICRVDKGAVGFIKVVAKPADDGGSKRTDLYASADAPVFCVGCKLHN